MSLPRITTWAKQTLTFQALNAEFNNILNDPISLISPLTGDLDCNGSSLIMDADGDTSISALTNDQISFTVGSTASYAMSATSLQMLASTRIDFDADLDTSIRASADDTLVIEVGGVDSYTITATSFDFNGLELILDADADSSITVDTDDVMHLRLQAFDAFIFDGDVVTPVNGLTFASSATGTPVSIASQGTDTNIDIDIIGKGAADLTINLGGFDALIVNGSTASLLNGLTITSTATGVAPQITGHGETDVSINLVPKGAGTIQVAGGILAGTVYNNSKVWAVSSMLDGASDTDTITVTGAALGDFCLISSSVTLAGGYTLTADVTSADTVTMTIVNHTGITGNPASATYYVRVFSRA